MGRAALSYGILEGCKAHVICSSHEVRSHYCCKSSLNQYFEYSMRCTVSVMLYHRSQCTRLWKAKLDNANKHSTIITFFKNDYNEQA